MGNGSLRFKDNSGNVVSFISGSGSDIIISGGTLNLLGMTEVTLGNVTISGTTISNENYLSTSSFNTYSGTTNTIIGSLQTSTGSLNSFTSSAINRFNSIENKTGSFATTGSNTFNGNLTVTGYIDAQELRTTFISSSILYRSGSTKFGDELTDTHNFTGSLSVSGSVILSTISSGSTETNILLVNNTGNIVYRNDLSLTGAQGFQGNQGPTGLQGTTGSQGNQGPTGLQGTTGSQGNQGPTGAQGNQGPTGLQGSTGASAGITSYTNPADNRVLTSVNSTTINAESNLTFDGTNLGIGTTSPSSKLDVVVTDGNYITISPTSGTNNNNSAGIRILGVNGIVGRAVGIYNYNDGSTDNNNMLFYTNYATTFSEKMRITSTGNVGIGTTSPQAGVKLDVYGATAVAGGSEGLRIGSVGDNSAYDNVKLWYAGYNSGAPRVYLTPRTTPGSGVIQTYFHLQNTNGNSTTSNNTMGLLVDGNVGIGTASPFATLDLGASGANNIILRNTTNAYNLGYLGNAGGRIDIGFSGQNGSLVPLPYLSVNTSGNVGIGTSSPVSKLSIVSSNSISANNVLTDSWLNVGSSLSSGFGIRQKGASNGISGIQFPLQMMTIGGLPFEIYTTDSQPLILGTNSTERLRITQDGNVGIGTSSPTNQTNYRFLQVNGTNSAIIETMVGGTRIGGFDSDASSLYVGTIGSYPIVFRTAVNEKMRITSSGAVLIGGTQNDYGKLDVTVSPSSYTAALGLGLQTNSGEGNSVGISFKTKISLSANIWENARIAAFTDGISSSAYGALAFYTMSATNLLERMRIGNNGFVGIGTTSPQVKLDVVGDMTVTDGIIKNTVSSISSVGDGGVNIFRFTAFDLGGGSGVVNGSVQIQGVIWWGDYSNSVGTIELIATCSNSTWTVHTFNVNKTGGNNSVSTSVSGTNLTIVAQKAFGGPSSIVRIIGNISFVGATFTRL